MRLGPLFQPVFLPAARPRVDPTRLSSSWALFSPQRPSAYARIAETPLAESQLHPKIGCATDEIRFCESCRNYCYFPSRVRADEREQREALERQAVEGERTLSRVCTLHRVPKGGAGAH